MPIKTPKNKKPSSTKYSNKSKKPFLSRLKIKNITIALGLLISLILFTFVTISQTSFYRSLIPQAAGGRIVYQNGKTIRGPVVSPTSYACNTPCTTNAQCQTANPNWTCYVEPCRSNFYCPNPNQGVCRARMNPTNARCQLAGGTNPTTPPTPVPTIAPPPPTPTSSTTKRIMTIAYNPVEGGKTYADEYFMAGKGMTAAQLEQNTFSDWSNAMRDVTKNRYNFQVVKQHRITTTQPNTDGFRFTLESYGKCVFGREGFDPAGCESKKNNFDYNKWITENKICELAEQSQVDEIWMLSLPYVMKWESFMVGPIKGFYVNGDTYVNSACKKQIIVMNATYQQPENTLHIMGHRVEAVMSALTYQMKREDAVKYWENFNQNSSNPRCGNTHRPANASKESDFASAAVTPNNCGDWENFPNITNQTTSVNCSAWGCTDYGWQKYWMGSLPSSAGHVAMVSIYNKNINFPKDWWTLILDPNQVIAKLKEMDPYYSFSRVRPLRTVREPAVNTR